MKAILNPKHKKISEASQEKFTLLNKKLGREAQKFDITQIKDSEVIRKLKLMKNIGTAALSKEKVKEFISLTSNMGQKYSTAKVLDYETKQQNYSLEPELTEILSKSRNPEELK